MMTTQGASPCTISRATAKSYFTAMSSVPALNVYLAPLTRVSLDVPGLCYHSHHILFGPTTDADVGDIAAGVESECWSHRRHTFTHEIRTRDLWMSPLAFVYVRIGACLDLDGTQIADANHRLLVDRSRQSSALPASIEESRPSCKRYAGIARCNWTAWGHSRSFINFFMY